MSKLLPVEGCRCARCDNIRYEGSRERSLYELALEDRGPAHLTAARIAEARRSAATLRRLDMEYLVAHRHVVVTPIHIPEQGAGWEALKDRARLNRIARALATHKAKLEANPDI